MCRVGSQSDKAGEDKAILAVFYGRFLFADCQLPDQARVVFEKALTKHASLRFVWEAAIHFEEHCFDFKRTGTVQSTLSSQTLFHILNDATFWLLIKVITLANLVFDQKSDVSFLIGDWQWATACSLWKAMHTHIHDWIYCTYIHTYMHNTIDMKSRLTCRNKMGNKLTATNQQPALQGQGTE